jgi:peptide/nickel transport system permease protein
MEAVVTYKSNWWVYVLKRVLLAVVSIILISLIIFFTVRLSIGDYYDYLRIFGYTIFDGTQSPMDAHRLWYEQQRNIYHLNEPLIFQWARWLGGIFTGDWGQSFMETHSVPNGIEVH